MKRNALETVYDHLYENIGNKWDGCAYCGDPSQTWDHVPSLRHVSLLATDSIGKLFLFKIPACIDCNSRLGCCEVTNVIDRVDYIRKSIRRDRLYRGVLKMPEWDDEELEDMSLQMEMEIRRQLLVKANVNRRLYHPVKNMYIHLDARKYLKEDDQ